MYTTIIASRAGEPLLAEALASITAQTQAAERVLVVCDSRETPPHEWTETLTAICPKVEFVLTPSHGQVPALNWGIEHSTTPYVAFLDSDDVWQPEKQARQIELLERNPDLDAASCLAANFRVDETGTPALEGARPSIMFTSTTFRRETFGRFGPLDPGSTHFTWLYRWWGRAKERGISVACVDYVGLHRRLHQGNSWTVDRRTAHRDLLAEIRRHAGQMRELSAPAQLVQDEVQEQ